MRYIVVFMIFIAFVKAQTLEVEQLFNIKTVKVKRVSLSGKKEYYGFLKADESRVYNLTLRFNGYIEDIYKDKTYSYVKKGEPLFSIYSPTLYAAIGELIKTEEFYKKTKSTNAKNMLESSKTKLFLLGFSKNEIKNFSKLSEPPKYVVIKSPYEGYIFKKSINLGSFVKNGETIYEIVNLKNIWMEALIYQNDLATVKKAKRAEIEIEGVDTNFAGKAKIIYPNMDKNSRSAILRISIKNYKNILFPGLYAKAKLIFSKKSFLALPKSAVIVKGDRYIVFVKGDFGDYEPKFIKAKPFNSYLYEIVSGLKEGEEVADNALFLLDADAQINGLYGGAEQ